MDYERHISGKTLNLARKSTCLAFNFCHLTNYIKQTSKKNDKKTNKQLKKQTTRRPTCPRSATETSCWREPPRTRLLHILVVMLILVDLDIDDDGGEVCQQQKDLRHVTMLRMLPRSWLMSSKLDGSLCIALLVMLLLLVIWEDSLDVLVSLDHLLLLPVQLEGEILQGGGKLPRSKRGEVQPQVFSQFQYLCRGGINWSITP